MKKSFGLLLVFSWSLFTFHSCKFGSSNPYASFVQVDTLADPVTRWQYFRNPETGLKEGPFKKLDLENNVLESGFYDGDKLHGLRVLYFQNGDTLSVETFDHGIYEGPYISFREDGSLELRGQYIQNEMKGEWERFYPNGQLMEIVTFDHNLENGPFIEYHPNGKLKAEGQYLQGDNEHGELKLYNRNGQLIRIMNCEKGTCRTTWSENK